MSTISAGTLLSNALVQTGDTSGNLVFQTNGNTTAMTIDTNQNVTYANGVSFTGVIAGNGANISSMNASNLISGTVATARLASGTANSSTYLRGDQTWAVLSAPNNGTLTMNTSGTGLTGSATFTADQSGNSTFTVTSNANSANGASTIVARDSSGNFTANAITLTTGSFSGGSNTAPSITFTGDTNTGIFSPAADTIAFTEGGTEVMRIDSSGNVGIGTTSSGNKFEVAGSGMFSGAVTTNTTGTHISYQSGNSQIGAWGPDTSTNGTLVFFSARSNGVNGLERFRIGPSGQLGIGGANYGTSGQVLTSNGSGSAPSWGLPTEYKIVEASTTTDRTLAGDSGWVTHLTVNFTTTQVCTVMCFANFAHGYEAGAVQIGARFTLDGTTSTTQLQVVKQGFGSNAAFGAHSSTGFFTNVSAGSHTITLQCRNFASGTTGILNYFDNPGPSTAIGDTIFILYK